MYMGGLYGKIAALMSADDFETLDAAIVKARKIEAGQYYDKQEPTNQALDDLTKKMQQMAVNYKKLTTALSARVETASSSVPSGTYQPQVRQYPPQQARSEGVTCYNCGERGHISGIALRNDVNLLGISFLPKLGIPHSQETSICVILL